mmetsp:Transcript_4767/g.19587  ORF Transcript_4767/g.19587 Transcript_4767/m.19587 type:complete len:253 (+) Transcript_4767:311-1069(+)
MLPPGGRVRGGRRRRRRRSHRRPRQVPRTLPCVVRRWSRQGDVPGGGWERGEDHAYRAQVCRRRRAHDRRVRPDPIARRARGARGVGARATPSRSRARRPNRRAGQLPAVALPLPHARQVVRGGYLPAPARRHPRRAAVRARRRRLRRRGLLVPRGRGRDATRANAKRAKHGWTKQRDPAVARGGEGGLEGRVRRGRRLPLGVRAAAVGRRGGGEVRGGQAGRALAATDGASGISKRRGRRRHSWRRGFVHR